MGDCWKVLQKNAPISIRLSILDTRDEYALSWQRDPLLAVQTVQRYRQARLVGIPRALLRKLRRGTPGV